MASSTHSVEQEELMAYLDGELSVDRAARVATHLEQCAECRARAAESRALSDQLAEWQVEPAPLSLSERVSAAIPAGEPKPHAAEMPLPSRPRFPQFALPRWAWAAAGAACVFLLIVAVAIPNLLRSRMAADRAATGLSGVGEESAQAPASRGALPSFSPSGSS
jgi:anti-sigma factor RsiW